jgi:hypothetical protein
MTTIGMHRAVNVIKGAKGTTAMRQWEFENESPMKENRGASEVAACE